MGYSLPGHFDGRTFRSHTETRWAIFFHSLELKYSYETQGFFSRSSAYLPDFAVFAAKGTVWVEVKGDWDTDPDGVKRWRDFAAERPQPSRAALLNGNPSADAEIIVIGGDESAEEPVHGPWESDVLTWRPCPAGIHFDLAFPGRFRSHFIEDGCEPTGDGRGDRRIAAAIYTARNTPVTGSAA